jgi:outer membrane protein OmpA-like peptidoglycan-associated protein
MRVRRNDSSPKLDLSLNLNPPNAGTAVTASTASSNPNKLSFPEPNPLVEFLGAGDLDETETKIPGLTHPNIQISEGSTTALMQMAQEDPALYGRIVQHLNGLDPKKSWSVNLQPFAKDQISDAQQASYQAQLDKSLSPAGLGAGGHHTSYFKGLVEYESIERTKEIAEATPGNAEAVQAMLDDIESWNTRLASSFSFENDVGDQVSNPEVSAAALDELVEIMKKHEGALNGASIELNGFTSTPGTDPHNQALSEERAATISSLLEERLIGTELEGRVTVTSTGHGEFRPLDALGQPLALDANGRPLDPGLEDLAKSRRVEIQVTPDPLVINGEPGKTANWREGAGIVLEIKAKPEGGGGGHHRRDGDNVTKSKISQKIGGEIPCKDWMLSLFRR